MKTLWKSRLALLVVAAEIIVGLLAGSALACGGSGGYRSPSRRSYPVTKVHVHRNTPVRPVAAAIPVAVAAPVIHPVGFVQQAAVAAPKAQFPLELVDVRLIDIGNPQAGQGPRFRVVLKNATPFPLNRPFEVMLSAGISDDFSPGLPTAVQGLAQLGPGEIAPVELRLPAEAMAMAYPGRQEPAPFSMLFVLIGGPKNVLGSSSVTTLAVLPLGEVRLVDLAVGAPEKTEVAVGTPVELPGEGFGPQAGQVLLNVAGLKLNVEVLGWSEVGIAIRMPQLALTEPTPVQLIVSRADGQLAAPLVLTAVLPDPNANKAVVEDVPFPGQGQPAFAPQGPAQPGLLPPNAVPQSQPQPQVAPQLPLGQPALGQPPVLGNSPIGPQEPLTLAQAFGGLGLPTGQGK